ncbi:MAG: hypothetical protein KKF62_17480 [Bacteroidetes bacterium]|nr:hypothetical protein [Bacteroidota bacterium]MBU1115421.1 hypothetical protein [Bacteroidota bacterium]MBU1797942.1 hypothetical protein [Bacteroidota bacterium]
MEKTFIYRNFLLALVLFSMIIASCSNDTGANNNDNEKIVRNSIAYTYGCPAFFIHPDVWRPPGSLMISRNTSGSAAWTPSGRVGPTYINDTKDNYISRLNNASIPNQNNYSEYKNVEDGGYPGVFYPDRTMEPEAKYQSGFVCYALVVRAMTDAGLVLGTNATAGIGYLLTEFTEITAPNSTTVLPGDIVVYDFDVSQNNGGDHVAIITKINGDNPNEWTVISSLGLVDYFVYGVKESKLDIFQDLSDGGIFEWWDDYWPEPLLYKIYTKRQL